MAPRVGPLSGVRILDAASLLAAPTTASFLSEFGAEVIKVEQPGAGDTMRRYPPFRGKVSLLWKVVGKNRRSLTLDLRKTEGRQVLMDLAKSCDIVLLNFRPETLAKWGLDFDDFVAVRDDIIVLQLTAYGRTGPYADRPGFARVAEAFSGLTFRTGFPGSPPSQSGYPMLGDGIAGMYCAFAVMLALRQRDLTGEPQLIDIGLYEPMFRILEDQIAAHAEDGTVMERSGNSNPLICPNGMFPTKDDRFVCIPASTETLWKRLVDLMGRPDLLKYDSNPERISHRDEIEGAVEEWTRSHELTDLVEICATAGVACGPVYSAAEIARDPHIAARGSIVEVFDEETGRPVRMAASAGRFSGFEATVSGTGPALGAHTGEVLTELLGYSAEQIEKLRDNGAV
ncbi:CaiB/BaiF CoA transferase family protein [Nocardia sp. NPDC058518]|uniref:CaiB/BaiF CoA transferase family protein n=1 Tax=Nocardia sp. NPDC058518 TaxID=3346534 RepID=UPI00364A0BC8